MDHLDIKISGKIQSSNFPIWKDSLLNHIRSINLKLVTDNDFAVASEDAKLLKRAEKALQEAKIKAIAQTEEIQSLFDSLDEVSEKARQSRLTLERQIRTKKQEIKDELINAAINDISDYISGKPNIFSQIDNRKYLLRHQFESAIKGKSSITHAEKSLKLLVNSIKITIDKEAKQVLSNLSLIEAIQPDKKLIFQDVSYLVTLPEKELRLTIENRIVKLSEQNALKEAADAGKELTAIDNEALYGTINKEKNRYIISIDLLCSRQEAIDIAREIKVLLGTSKFILDIKLRKSDA
jgi:hypothetical protein